MECLGIKEERIIRRAVITGATCAMGTALAKRLLDENIRVLAVVRPESLRTGALKDLHDVDLVSCDISQLKTLPDRISGGADAFFHFAWSNTVSSCRNDIPSQIANIQYTIDAVQAAKKLGCKVFLGAGSQAEYGRVEGKLCPETPCFPENGYGMAKLCAGQMSRIEAQSHGIAHIWPRILSVYGPHDGASTMISSTIRKLLAGEKPSLTAGEQKWDYLYSEDAAEALWLMACHGADGAVYPLGSGQSLPLRTYIETLRDSIDPTLPLGFGEIPYSPLQVMHLQADISALQQDTGFQPKTSFADGIQKTIMWVR